MYKANFKGKDFYMYLLIEFQSTVDKFMSLRMLHYIVEFYEFLVKEKKVKTLPAVFPLLLYSGKKKCAPRRSVYFDKYRV
ncbi:MAG: Rpn family recombination-promoting nuclease/putative transposase [Spirochaetia bacterium]|nr:Rpn family recombination-promoting nuclease/putative transposase [Spirochaetia bacterium]